MTPSLPTLSNASAISSPISGSCAEIVGDVRDLALLVDLAGDVEQSLGDGLRRRRRCRA